MTLLVRALILSVVFLFASGPASGLVISLAASIDGAQANGGAGTGSSATGSASLTFDDQTNELTWSGSYSGLGSDFLVAHFHGPAAPGVNAGVALGISVVGNTSGTFDGSSTLSAGQAADLLAGLWYINIHSTTFTGGEIRGQVLVAPEPALGLVLGVAALAVVRRRGR